MKIESELAHWAVSTQFEDLPIDVVAAMKLLTRTIIGTAVAGATANGCEATVEQVREWSGRREATIWLHGDKVPSHAAALANSTMARALDICDAQVPGQHIGSSAVPVAFAVSELVGGVTGREFLTALAVGAEVATRLGFAARLDGFDPTGSCSIFAACVTAGKLLGLNTSQMHHAMALTFNRAGSSFQSNVDASLAVRLIQGFISQDGIICAQLAKRNLTGPMNWLSGVWGYYHLFCDDQRDDNTVVGDLGKTWYVKTFGYKTRPQCGATIASTDAIIAMLEEHSFDATQVENVNIHMGGKFPSILVGSKFEVGDHPQVNGQFNVRYCVANAIIHKSSQLHHFTDEAVSDAKVGALAQRIHVHHTADLPDGVRERLEVRLKDGRILIGNASSPSGYPPKVKSQEMHDQDFKDHVAYGGLPLHSTAAQSINSIIDQLEQLQDVCSILPHLISHVKPWQTNTKTT